MTVNTARLLFIVLVVLPWCSDFLPQPRHVNGALVGDPTVLLSGVQKMSERGKNINDGKEMSGF